MVNDHSLYRKVVLEPLRLALEATLADEFKAVVAIRHLSVTATGLFLKDLRLTARATSKGSSSTSLSVRRVRLVLDWWPLLRAERPRLRRTELDGAVVVLADSREARAPPNFSAMVQQVLDHGMRSLLIRELQLSARVGRKRQVVRLLRGNFDCTREGNQLVLTLDSKQFFFEDDLLGTVQVRVRASPEELHVELGELRASDGLLQVKGLVDWAEEAPQLVLSGLLELRSRRWTQRLTALTASLTVGTILKAESAHASFTISGPLFDARQWVGSSHFRLAGALAQSPDLSAELLLETLVVDAERTASGIQLTKLEARGDGLEVQAQVNVQKTGGHQLSGTLRVRDLAVLRRVSPAIPLLDWVQDDPSRAPRGIEVNVNIHDSPSGVRVQGTVKTGQVVLRWNSVVPMLPISHLETQFEYLLGTPPSLSFDQLVVQTPAGTLRGNGVVAGGQHHLVLGTQNLDASLLSPHFPGTMQRGQVGGNVTIDGSEETPLQRVRARVEVRKARWQLPDGYLRGLAKIELQQASARVEKRHGEWHFSNIEVNGFGQPSSEAGNRQLAHGKLTGSAVFRQNTHHLEIQAKQMDVRLLNTPLAGVAERGTLRGSLVVNGTRANPWRSLAGQVTIENTILDFVSTATSSTKLELKRASSRILRDRKRWSLSNLDLEGAVRLVRGNDGKGQEAQGTLRGSAIFEPGRHRFDLNLARVEGPLLNAAFPEILEGGIGSGSFVIEGAPGGTFRSVVGEVEILQAKLLLPSALAKLVGSSLHRAAARVKLNGSHWQILDAEVHVEDGTVWGEASSDGVEHRATMTFEPTNMDRLSSLIPGRVSSGAVQVVANIRGTPNVPFRRVAGSLRVEKALWSPPAEAPLCTEAMLLDSATANYSWDSQQLQLSELHIRSKLLHAKAQGRWHEGVTEVEGQVELPNAGSVLELVPELRGVVEGGRASIAVRLQATAGALSGSVKGGVKGGLLKLPEPGQVGSTKHSIHSTTFHYDFEKGTQNLRHFRLRGPELNANIHASWSEYGKLRGGGRFWLSRGYTNKVTKGGRWALQMLGYPRIETTFQLHGSRRAIRMNAAIAHGWRWQILRVAVPDRLEDIALGRILLFSADKASEAACDH